MFFSKALRHYSSSAAPRLLEAVQNRALIKTESLINGNWVGSSKSFDVRDPGLVPHQSAFLAKVACHDKDAYNDAIDAAHEAFKTFKKTTARERGDML